MPQIIADLQIHSRHSRATSKDLTLTTLEKYARIKGITLLGTGDFQHPKWRQEIKAELTEDDRGILWSKTKFPFFWQTEISLMYTQDGKGRRIHHLIYAPNGEVAAQITEALGKRGRLDYDGRPIFGFSSIELVEMMRAISHDIEIVPSHAWTPWFGALGSNGGFDSLKQCFGEYEKHIHAIETGMSSDPPMNWRLSQLDGKQLISSSDAHSFWPWRLGREANLFDCEYDAKEILKAIRTGNGLTGTIEVNPNYGKYHVDGHRNCNVVFEPKESRARNNICPKCKKKLTIGVLHRVEELADRPEGYVMPNAKKFYTLIPLTELIAARHNITLLGGKKVWEIYNSLINNFKNEFIILLETPEKELIKVIDEKLTKLIIQNREGTLKVEPGYDGVYGKVIVDEKTEQKTQKKLSDF